MSDVKAEFKEGKFEFGLDADNDGAMSIKGELVLNEAIAEAFGKGTPVEGVKTAKVMFQGMSLVVLVDSDKDGEHVLKLEMNLPEGFDEAAKRF